VDNHLFPIQSHRANLDLPGLPDQAFSGRSLSSLRRPLVHLRLHGEERLVDECLSRETTVVEDRCGEGVVRSGYRVTHG
jgi:hypothetical protein